MISCLSSDRPFRCPSQDEVLAQIMALLPRGRAWQTHEAIGDRIEGSSASYGEAEHGGTAGAGFDGGAFRATGLQQYWAAYAALLAWVHERACALLEEMFCHTAVELRGEWGVDHGFPGSCEPFAGLCDKVAAVGGNTCAYFELLAERIGYTIVCQDYCSGRMLANQVPANLGVAAGGTPNRVHILVTGGPNIQPSRFIAGLIVANLTPPCPPGLEALACLIDRYKPAHVAITYEVAA